MRPRRVLPRESSLETLELQLQWIRRRLMLLTGLSLGTAFALLGWFLWIGHC